MKKIFLTKSDTVPATVEKILAGKDKHIVLVIPRGAAVATSLDHFHTIRREAKEAGRSLFIETVDNQTLALAKAAKIEAANPFFAGPRRSLSDIVISEAPDAKEEDENDDEEEGTEAGAEADTEKADGEDDEEEDLDERIQEKFQERSTARSVRRIVALFGTVLVLVGGGVIAVTVLPRAAVEIVTRKTQWEYADTLAIAGQVFSETKSVQRVYPASEQRTVSKKATGTVTIFNAYSSAPQILVASTRLEMSDKKTYRLDERVVVPGAKIEGGEIVPSSITATVTADKAGETYNIGPVGKFVIPGFREANLPQYDGFYGASDAAMAGGFEGTVWYPSDTDLEAARADIEKELRTALDVVIASAIPDEFTVVGDQRAYELVREEIVENRSGEKNFTLLVEATMRVPAYRNADILDALVTKAREQLGSDLALRTHTLEAYVTKTEASTAQLTLATTFSGSFVHAINTDQFKERAAGKEEIDLRALVFSLPGVESATISLWPIWLSRVPEDPEKIRISID